MPRRWGKWKRGNWCCWTNTIGQRQGWNRRTVLSFLGQDSKPELEIGIGEAQRERFVRFLSRDGRVLVALNSLGLHEEPTLYMGDGRWGSRIILGALRTDMDRGEAAVENWVLSFRKPGSLEQVFTLLVNEGDDRTKATAGLRMIRSNGKVWVR